MEAEKAVVLEEDGGCGEEELEDEIRIMPSSLKRKRSAEDSDSDSDSDDEEEEDDGTVFTYSDDDSRLLYAHILEPLLQDQTLSHEFLCHSLTNALCSDPESRRLADERLTRTASNHPGPFPLALLHVVTSSSNKPPGILDYEKVRCAAAVRLKHHVTSYLHTIPSLDRNYIKSITFCLMLSLPPHNNNNIQLHLREALSVICNSKDTGDASDLEIVDFEHVLGFWHRPVVELVSKLRHATLYADPIGLIIGFANQISTNFQQQRTCWTGDFFLDLRDCFHRYFVRPVVEIFLKTASSIDSFLSSSSATDLTMAADALTSLFNTQRLCYRAFCSTDTLSAPGGLDTHMDEWVTSSLNYMVKKYPPALKEEEEVYELRLAVFDYFTIALRMRSQLNVIYVRGMSLPVLVFVEDLTASASSSSHDERLLVFAMKCLIQIQFEVNKNNILPRILTNIVIPNVLLREEDEELFETNHAEFIRRNEMQLTGCHTRRGLAIQLLKHLVTTPQDYGMVMDNFIPGEIEVTLKSFAADPTTNWKGK